MNSLNFFTMKGRVLAAVPAETETTAGGGGRADEGAPASSAAPAVPQGIGADGSLGDQWYRALGEDLSEHSDTLKNFKNISGLAKSYVHLRKHGPCYPGQDAAPEEIDRFRALAQVPETPDAYGLTAPDELPEGVEWSDEFAGKMAEIGHKYHVPAPAMNALAHAYLENEGALAQAAMEQQQERMRQAQDTLIGEWGAKYAQHAGVVRDFTTNLALTCGISPEDPYFNELANNPTFARMVLRMATMTSEDAVRAPSGMMDMRSSRQRAEAIMSGKDPEWGERYLNRDPEAFRLVSRLL
jgi:hypothetical protein